VVKVSEREKNNHLNHQPANQPTSTNTNKQQNLTNSTCTHPLVEGDEGTLHLVGTVRERDADVAGSAIRSDGEAEAKEYGRTTV
jgi:hypothetical protein